MQEIKSKTLMQRLLEAGYPRDQMFNHELDLYVFVTPLTKRVVEEWCKENKFDRHWMCPIFTDQITGRPMYDCAFQYDISELLEDARRGSDYIFKQNNRACDIQRRADDAESEVIRLKAKLYDALIEDKE